MKLLYSNQSGASREFELTDKPVTIGRSPDADIILLDDKVSRRHVVIRGADGAFFVKDLESKNGTFVNGERVETARLLPADVIKVGGYTFTFEQSEGLGAQTALREISDEMSAGKGYATLLKQIVDGSDVPVNRPSDAPAVPPVKMPEAIKAPPKIVISPQPETANVAPVPASPPPAPAPDSAQAATPALTPAVKKPLGPTRPKILLRPPVKPSASAASAAPDPLKPPEAARPDDQAPAAPENTGKPRSAPVKPVIRKPARPVIRLNMNKKT